jgi:hypothetical protein
MASRITADFNFVMACPDDEKERERKGEGDGAFPPTIVRWVGR